MSEPEPQDPLFSVILETTEGNKHFMVAVSGLAGEEAIEEAASAAGGVAADLKKTVIMVRPAELVGHTDLAGVPIPSHPRSRLIDPSFADL